MRLSCYHIRSQLHANKLAENCPVLKYSFASFEGQKYVCCSQLFLYETSDVSGRFKDSLPQNMYLARKRACLALNQEEEPRNILINRKIHFNLLYYFGELISKLLKSYL